MLFLSLCFTFCSSFLNESEFLNKNDKVQSLYKQMNFHIKNINNIKVNYDWILYLLY